MLFINIFFSLFLENWNAILNPSNPVFDSQKRRRIYVA
jgi:hypothetical protein